jgi:hypothetical protein
MQGVKLVVHRGIFDIASGGWVSCSVSLIVSEETLSIPELPEFAHDFG